MSALDLTFVLICYLGAVNAATMAVCIYDRWAAVRFWSRVPERFLLILSVAGGVPAAKLVQILSGYKRLREDFTLNLNLIAMFHLAIGVASWAATSPLADRFEVEEVADTASVATEETVPPEPRRFGPGS